MQLAQPCCSTVLPRLAPVYPACQPGPYPPTLLPAHSHASTDQVWLHAAHTQPASPAYPVYPARQPGPFPAHAPIRPFPCVRWPIPAPAATGPAQLHSPPHAPGPSLVARLASSAWLPHPIPAECRPPCARWPSPAPAVSLAVALPSAHASTGPVPPAAKPCCRVTHPALGARRPAAHPAPLGSGRYDHDPPLPPPPAFPPAALLNRFVVHNTDGHLRVRR